VQADIRLIHKLGGTAVSAITFFLRPRN
jgi:hypothetical protein